MSGPRPCSVIRTGLCCAKGSCKSAHWQPKILRFCFAAQDLWMRKQNTNLHMRLFFFFLWSCHELHSWFPECWCKVCVLQVCCLQCVNQLCRQGHRCAGDDVCHGNQGEEYDCVSPGSWLTLARAQWPLEEAGASACAGWAAASRDGRKSGSPRGASRLQGPGCPNHTMWNRFFSPFTSGAVDVVCLGFDSRKKSNVWNLQLNNYHHHHLTVV